MASVTRLEKEGRVRSVPEPDAIRPLIGPYESQPAACRDYDPRAADVARRVARALRDVRPQLNVEHVGSTAVPGCVGKGIVDLLIPVADADLEPVKQALAQLGFQPQTSADPFPESRPMRVGALDHEGTRFLIHVHVVPAQSPEVDEMRFFRTCLRADPELMQAYVAKKRALIAAGVTDALEYCRQKGAFIKDVLG
jgi:GrpB-like predicted nucleotidyltransferase (UPF0157 family)